MGAGCKLGEHLLKFELDNDSTSELSTAAAQAGTQANTQGGSDAEPAQPTSDMMITLGELAVREKSSVLQLKEMLLAKWAALAATVKMESGAEIPKAPPSADYLRVRDGKVPRKNCIVYTVSKMLCAGRTDIRTSQERPHP
jgi:hypothetical protein